MNIFSRPCFFSKGVLVCLLMLLTVPAGNAQTVQTLARLTAADGLAVDAQGNVFASRYDVAPEPGTVYKITPEGNVSVFLNNQEGPADLIFDQAGNLYIGLFNANAIRRVAPNGDIDIVATSLSGPLGLVFDEAENLHVLNDLSPDIIRIGPGGSKQRVGVIPGLGFGSGLTRDDDGNFYAASYSSGNIYKVTPNGDVSLFAQTPGQAHGFVIFVNGVFYATGIRDNRIYRISTAGEVSVLAGTGQRGHVDGPAATAQFQGPNGLTASVTGDTLYVADATHIRMVILSTATNVGQTLPQAEHELDMSPVFPNPFHGAAIIPITLTRSYAIEVGLYDLQGRFIQVIHKGLLHAGHHQFALTAPQSLAPGIYFIRTQADGIAVVRPIVHAR